MIKEFFDVGESILEDPSDEKEVITHISYQPRNEEDSLHPIVINLDVDKEKIDLHYEKKYNPRRDKGKFCFMKTTSPRGKRVYFNTNNISYHINSTITDTIDKITEILESYPERQEILLSFREYLKKVQEIFCVTEKKILDYNKLDTTQKIEEYDSNPSNYSGYFQKSIIDSLEVSTKSQLSNHDAYCLYINDKNIFDTDYADAYALLLYYDKIGYLFSEDGKECTCHICSKKKKVTNSLKLPFKVYIEDKVGFFQRGDLKKSYKSFSLCEDCFRKIIVGTEFVRNELSEIFLGNRLFILPKSAFFYKNFLPNVKMLKDKIHSQLFGHREIARMSQQKQFSGYVFDFLFYQREQSSFKISRNISDISSEQISQVSENFRKIQEDYFKEEDYYFSFKTLNYVLFSHNSWGEEERSRLMFDYLDYVYNNIEIDMDEYYAQVLKNYKKEYLAGSRKCYSIALKSFLLAKFFRLNRNLEDDNMNFEMESELENDDLIEFFNKHEYLDTLKRGLIVFGYYVNKIIRIQRGKTSNFLDKIRFSGMDRRDMRELVLDFQEYLKIYESKGDGIYEEPSEKAFALEAITKYLESDVEISPSEVSYFVLFGVNLGKYFGKKHARTRRLEEDE